MKHSTQDAQKEWVDLLSLCCSTNLLYGTKRNSRYGQKGTGHVGHCLIAVKCTGTLEVIEGIAMKRKPNTKAFKVRTLEKFLVEKKFPTWGANIFFRGVRKKIRVNFFQPMPLRDLELT